MKLSVGEIPLNRSAELSRTRDEDIVCAYGNIGITRTKNREFGTCEYILCNYDPANRRIFQSNYGDRTIYGWDHEGLVVPEIQACTLPEFRIQSGAPESNESSYPF